MIILIVCFAILLYISNRLFFSGGICKSKNRLDGKVCLITGANNGIGYETALEFAKRGATVIMACRDLKKGQKAADKITRESGNSKIQVEYVDLSDLDSVRHFAGLMNKKLTRLDVLVNNAALMMCPLWRTKQGFEMQFGTNYLSHFLLTNLLLDLIKQTNKSRIINVSSIAHTWSNINWNDINWEKSYSPIRAYAQSKLANALFGSELARRLKNTGVASFYLHPGAVRTGIMRHVGESLFFMIPLIVNTFYPFYWVCTKSPSEGAQTIIHCAVSDEALDYDGKYFSDCCPKKPSAHARNKEYATKLWKMSEQMVGL